MSVFISNTAYLAKAAVADCLPLIAWKSTLQLSDITSSGAVDLRVASNLWGADTATFWQPPSGASSVTLANPGASSIDYIAMAKHNLGSAGITYTLSSSSDGVTYSPIGSARVVEDDSSIIDFFDASTSQFFKIEFSGGTPIIAHIRMGSMLVLPYSIYVGHAPATLAKVVERLSQTSSVGQFLGQVVLKTNLKASLKQENVDPVFMRTQIAPFIAHANGSRLDDGTARGSFFFAWRPVDYANEVIYAWTEENIHPENQRTNGMMSFSFNMVGCA